MIEQRHSINGTPSPNGPANKDELNVVLNYDNDNPQGTSQVSIKSYKWIDQEARQLRAIFDQGTTGGNGVFEGVPHLITISDPAYNLSREFPMIINLKGATFDRNIVTADSMPLAQLDWINDVADSFSFEYLYSIGRITRSDFTYVPYVISANPNYKEAFIVTLTLTVIIIQVQEIISALNAEIIEAASYIDSIGGLIRLVFRLIYVVLLFLTILELILDLIALIIQKVKYVPGMYVNDLLRIGAEFLGLTYQSDLLMNDTNSKLFIIPANYDQSTNIEDSRIRGIFNTNDSDQRGYPQGTFGQLVRDIKIATGTKVIITDKLMRLVPDFVPPSSASVTMKKLDQEAFRTNADDLFANINITFQPDTSDKNTLDNWTGTNVDVSFRLKTPPDDPTRSLLSNGKLIAIPYARATRKNSLTVPEKICQVLLEALALPVNAVITITNTANAGLNLLIEAVNKIIDVLDFLIDIPFELPLIPDIPKIKVSDLIEDRIGMMLIEADYFAINKLVLIEKGSKPRNTKIAINNSQIISARYIYVNYYRGINTQYLRRNFRGVELNMFDILNLINDQAIVIPNGNTAKLISCNWNEKQRVAEVTVDEPYIYCNNLNENINEPLGR